jgi:DNA-binding response OmpR family regulator
MSTTAEKRNGKAKILIIDDDVNTTVLMDNVFTKDGFEVTSVNNSSNALSAALSTHPDLILLDLLMPHVDGIETCKTLSSHPELNRTPILFFSAVGDVSAKVEAFNAGARDFISKPIHLEELKSRVRVWVEKRSHKGEK